METTGAQANGHVEHVQVSPNSDGTAENEKSSAGLHAHTSDQSSGETGRMANALKVKKRTKTGCLTCRRRRIKCGEERPTCRNCSKSKRECEGYVPRVVFKDPVQAIQNGIDGLQEIPYGLQSYEGVGAGFGGMNPMSAYGISLIPLAPRPTTYDEYAPYLHTSRVVAPYASAVITPESNQFTLHQDSNAFHPGQQPPGHFTSSHCDLGLERPSVVADTQSDLYLDLEPSRTRTDDFAVKPKVASSSWLRTDVSPPTPTSQYPTPLTGSTSDESTLFSPFTWPHPTIIPEAPAPAIAGSDDRLPAKHWHKPPNVPDSVPSPTPEDEDDPYDIDSDEDDTKMSAPSGDCQANDLSLMIRVAAHQNNSNMRSISNFLNEPNVLATYQPSYSTSPLMDPQTARVFCHFITATGPMLNVCERHPSNPSVIFQGRPVPQFQRALWSYKLPMLALQHSCLLHAMLAIASLHIANLQRTSPTPSLKHYHFALRRVAKALRKPDRRRNVSTLAATLLLGYYEVTTAEHNKWNSHLAGARELIVEVDFATAARKVEAYKTQQEIAEMHIPRFGFDGLDGYAKLTGYDLPVKASRRLDQNLLSTIMGWAMDFNHYERIDEPLLPATYSINSQDVETAEIQCDLYWWYAKQDVYQSIISGNRLLLSYDRWGQCPPRTPMGRQDAPYGSMDHLLLLMGRLADFASKDLPRKRRQVQAQAATTTTPSPTSANGMPPMYGMMPDPGPVVVPRGFDQGQQDRIYAIPVPSADKSLEAATADAQAEHAAIAYAFDVFFDALGPSFAPLSPEHMTPTTTPFGPSIYYRSYPIACLLTLYNCGRIILARTAPHMPPAAMAAAGVAAHATAVYANTIGRICAGIQPVSNTAPLNPHHGAALMDVCMGLFHAGVQYRDAAQRGWTISKLRDVARLTGWQSSALIASGCERAWARAAEMGKGPPYQRTVTSEFKDARMTGRTKDPRMSSVAPKSNNDRSFVRQNAGTRVYWAMGILSMEEDMREMNLGHDER